MVELIYCAGKATQYAQIAIEMGFTYGAQLPCRTYYPVQFADQNWKAPDRDAYMKALAIHRPRIASILDWEYPEQLAEVLEWAREAAQYATETIIIIPKVSGGISSLPRTIGGKEIRLGYSVPTKHGGTNNYLWEFLGWPLHLLGGSPQRQYALATHFPLDVRSVDGNGINAHARKGRFFAATRIRRAKNSHAPQLTEVGIGDLTDAPYHCLRLSFANIRALWMGCPVAIRYATEADLPEVKSIANQWSGELGYVMWPALREAIVKNELYVAESQEHVVGFCKWHRRRDGWSTIYEVAIDKAHLGNHIGRALVEAVPLPRRLKCTVDNHNANAFYSHIGGQIVRTELGRKRPLYVYEWQTISAVRGEYTPAPLDASEGVL